MNLFELMATISLNTSEYEKGIDTVESGASTANSAMESIDTEPAESGLDDVGEAADSASEDLGEFSEEANDVDLEGLEETTESAGDGLDELGETAGATGDDMESLGESAGAAGEDVESFADTADSASADIESVGDAADDAGSGIDDFADAASSAGDDVEDVGDSASSAGDDMSSMGDDASSAGDDIDSMADSAESAADSLDAMGESASGAVDGVEGLGSSMGGTLASGSTEAAGAMSGFNEVIDGFKTGGLVGGVVAGVSAIGTGIYKMATETQDASAIIAQGTGATGDSLEEMTQRAKGALSEVKLASETDLESVAETLAETNTRFGLTGDALEETTTRVEDFAGVTGQEGAAAVDALADVMGKWHIETEDMPGLMDQLTVASQASGASASDLEASLSANSAAFDEMGMSIDDSISFMAAYEKAGGNSSDMNKILKSAISNLNGEVDDMPGAFMDAISAIENADDATDALNAQVGDTGMTVEDVFGTKTANQIIQTCQSSSFSLEDMEGSLANCDGAMEQTAEDSVTFKDKVQGAFDKLKEGCGNAWQSIKGFFTDTKDTGTEAGDGLVKGLDDSSENVKKSGKKLGKAVVDGANDELETHSPSKVMESIGGNVTDGLQNGMSGMADKVSGIFKGVMGNVTSFGNDAEKSASSTGSGFVSKMQSGLSGLASTVSGPLSSALSNATGWGSSMGSESSGSASQFVSRMRDGLSNLSNEVRNKLNPVTSTASSWGSGLSTSFNSMGKNVINGMINGIGGMVGNLYTSIKNSLSGLVDKAKGALGISSPSTVFRDEVGAMIGEGLALGIEDSTGEVEDAIDDMIDATDVGEVPIGSATMEAGGQMAVWNDNFDKLFDLLGVWLPALANMQMVTDTGVLAGELAAPINKELGKLSSREERR